jgi:hypothetical protein
VRAVLYTAAMTWELIWMLVILKIPVIYVCLVVWWAVRAKPAPLEPAIRTVPGELDPRPGWRFVRRPRGPRSGPHGAPGRGYRPQAARARAE